ncbi:MAG: LacI family transcriptional regulator, partial [Clostridiales bacterium]|nr:LacI family transcriptional regulator [Clostridiales bacterium]
MVTIYDIAQKSGFAVGTVSKALNNYYGVNDTTRKKIIEVAQKMGYTPNANARALKAKHSYNLGVLFYLRDSLDLSQYFFIKILNQFKHKADMNGYD